MAQENITQETDLQPAALQLSLQAKIVVFAIFLATTVLSLTFVEAIAGAYLRSIDQKSYPLVLNLKHASSPGQGVIDRRLSQGLNLLDPHLGYARPAGGPPNAYDSPWRWPGFKTTGKESESGERIVVLGGSTTDPYYVDEWGSWSDELYRAMEKESQLAVIYNGGVSGYSTNQELIKLLRDVSALSPKTVISLSGVNDLGFAHSISTHPMVNAYQLVTLEAITGKSAAEPMLMPNIVAAFRRKQPSQGEIGVTMGVPFGLTDVEMWQRNVSMMRAISASIGADFHVFLQPVLGVDRAYAPTPEEAALYKAMLKEKPGYESKALLFYDGARNACSKMDFCHDISWVFAGKTDMYHDPRHPNHEGNKLIGREVFRILAARTAPLPQKAVGNHVVWNGVPTSSFPTSDFESWAATGAADVKNSVAIAPSEQLQAASIRLPAHTSLMKRNGAFRIPQATKVKASIYLWADEPGEVIISIARDCGSKNPELGAKKVAFDATPRKYELEYEFKHNQLCARLQLRALSEKDAIFYAWNAQLGLVEK